MIYQDSFYSQPSQLEVLDLPFAQTQNFWYKPDCKKRIYFVNQEAFYVASYKGPPLAFSFDEWIFFLSGKFIKIMK